MKTNQVGGTAVVPAVPVAQPILVVPNSKVEKSMSQAQTNFEKASAFAHDCCKTVLTKKVLIPLTAAGVAGHLLRNQIHGLLPQAVADRLPGCPVPSMETVTGLASSAWNQATAPTGIPFINQGTAALTLVAVAALAARTLSNQKAHSENKNV
jgi:hypothetical protein